MIKITGSMFLLSVVGGLIAIGYGKSSIGKHATTVVGLTGLIFLLSIIWSF